MYCIGNIEEIMNPHNDPKMERICNICGVMYSEVISKECPLCKRKREFAADDNVVSIDMYTWI